MKTTALFTAVMLACIQRSSADTIANYVTSGCLDNSLAKISTYSARYLPKSFKLSNGTLSIWGQIRTNCCGTHTIKYDILDSVIRLKRLDEEICVCDCAFQFSITLPGCTAQKYHVLLPDYWGDSIDTTITINQVSAVKPNSVKNNTITNNQEMLFDISGRKANKTQKSPKRYLIKNSLGIKPILFNKK